jgi:preprotein translocase subunit SecE
MATKVGAFLGECLAELKKVVWPARNDVVAAVKVVIISTAFLAVLLGLLDAGFTAGFRALMK